MRSNIQTLQTVTLPQSRFTVGNTFNIVLPDFCSRIISEPVEFTFISDNYCNNDYNKRNDSSSSSYNDDNEKQQQRQQQVDSSAMSGSSLYRHCKLKTFQKIKFNLITHHGNSGGGVGGGGAGSVGGNHCSSTSASSLQTIVETDNDVITANTTQTTTNSGLYQIIDEKYKAKENELSLKVISGAGSATKNTTTTTTTPSNKYKLLDLSSMDRPCEKQPSTTVNNTVSKRIEFFEHANIPNGGIIQPKSNIYSIYRVNDMLLEDEKLVKSVVVKEKEAGSSKTSSATSFLLKHDSQTLTIILSCVFIVSFLLLIFFPLPG